MSIFNSVVITDMYCSNNICFCSIIVSASARVIEVRLTLKADTGNARIPFDFSLLYCNASPNVLQREEGRWRAALPAVVIVPNSYPNPRSRLAKPHVSNGIRFLLTNSQVCPYRAPRVDLKLSCGSQPSKVTKGELLAIHQLHVDDVYELSNARFPRLTDKHFHHRVFGCVGSGGSVVSTTSDHSVIKEIGIQGKRDGVLGRRHVGEGSETHLRKGRLHVP